MLNGKTQDKTQQVIDCGAVVRIDEAVLTHGILFIHPDLPPIKLMLDLDSTKHTIGKYAFIAIAPEHGTRTQFAVHLHETTAPVVVVPEEKKLIIPGG